MDIEFYIISKWSTPFFKIFVKLKVFLKIVFWTFLQFCGTRCGLTLSTASCRIFIERFETKQYHIFGKYIKIIYFKNEAPQFLKMIIKLKVVSKMTFWAFLQFCGTRCGLTLSTASCRIFIERFEAKQYHIFGKYVKSYILKMKHPNF